MTKTEHLKRSLWYVFVLVLSLTIVIAYFTRGMMAKYVMGAQAGNDARVATFDVSETNTLDSSPVAVELYPGSSPSTIIVNAHSDGETAVRCIVKVNEEGNLPLIYTPTNLTQDGENTWYYDFAPSEGDKELQLDISWDPDNTGYEYASGVELLYLSITFEQID